MEPSEAKYGIPERTKLSIKIHGQIVKNFHGQNVIISCSWCVQDFMVMVRFHFHAHGLVFVVMVNSLIPAGARGGSLGTRLANY